jgi:hypothetical protein
MANRLGLSRARGEAFGRGLATPAACAVLVVHVIAVAAVVWLAAAGSRPLVQVGVRPLPDWLAGPLGSVGELHVSRAIIGLLLAGLLVSYVAVLALVDHLPRRLGLRAIVVAAAIVFVGPPLLSGDVFTYIDQGRLFALHGLNPYRFGADAAPGDPTQPYLHFHTGTSVYGPLFTLLAAALAPLGLAGTLWALKAVAFGSALAIVWLTATLAARAGRSPVRAAAFVGLNPLFLLYTLGGAHNDLLAIALGLAGLALVTRRPEGIRWPALVVASAAVKATGALFAPFALLASARRGRAVMAGAICTAVVVVLAVVAFGPRGWASAGGAVAAGPAAATSVPGVVAKLLTGHPDVSPVVHALVSLAGLLALAFVVMRVARRRWDPLTGAGWATFVLLVFTTRLLPWYVAWLLPPAAVSVDRRLRAAALALTAYVVYRWLPG